VVSLNRHIQQQTNNFKKSQCGSCGDLSERIGAYTAKVRQGIFLANLPNSSLVSGKESPLEKVVYV
jgi:hypothetical protein